MPGVAGLCDPGQEREGSDREHEGSNRMLARGRESEARAAEEEETRDAPRSRLGPAGTGPRKRETALAGGLSARTEVT